MPINLRPIAYGTGLTLSTDGKLRIEPISTKYDYEIRIEQRERNGAWMIALGNTCLTREAVWERGPVPSSERDDDWYARCRYASLEEAADWLRQCAERSEG